MNSSYDELLQLFLRMSHEKYIDDSKRLQEKAQDLFVQPDLSKISQWGCYSITYLYNLYT